MVQNYQHRYSRYIPRMNETEISSNDDEFNRCWINGNCSTVDKWDCEAEKGGPCACECHVLPDELTDEEERELEREELKQLRESIAEEEAADKETGAVLRIYAPNATRKDHLDKVIEEMEQLGPPDLIPYVYTDGDYFALDGSHRLAAAKKHGFKPTLLEFDLGAMLPDGIEVLDGEGKPVLAERVKDAIPYLTRNHPYDFPEPIEGAH